MNIRFKTIMLCLVLTVSVPVCLFAQPPGNQFPSLSANNVFTGTNSLPICVYPVSLLPTNRAPRTICIAADGNPGCTAGGGTNLALCQWTGTVWKTVSTGTGANGTIGGGIAVGQMAGGTGANTIGPIPGWTYSGKGLGCFNDLICGLAVGYLTGNRLTIILPNIVAVTDGTTSCSLISGAGVTQICNIHLTVDPSGNLVANSFTGSLTGNASTATTAGLSGTTGIITGTALTATCDSGTASVTGAVVGHPVAVSSATGADVGGAFDLRASVTTTNTVSVYICGTGTPSSLAYNVRVF